MKTFLKIWSYWPVQLIGFLCMIYTGLGMLGVIGGWSNVNTILSKLMGSLFCFNGTMQLLQLAGIIRNPTAAVGKSDDDVREFLASGERMKAFRLYRALHNVSLRDARESIEKMKLEI